ILEGAAQIAVPALVSTLCICIVFVPMFFLTGVAKFLFVPLAEAVVFAMLATYLLSRTLVATLLMYLLRGHEHEEHHEPRGIYAPLQGVERWFEDGFAQRRDGCHSTPNSCLEQRRVFSSSFLLFCVVSVGLVFFLGQ